MPLLPLYNLSAESPALGLISGEMRCEAALLCRRLLLSDDLYRALAVSQETTLPEPVSDNSRSLLTETAVAARRLRKGLDTGRDPYNLHLLPYGFRRDGAETLEKALLCAELVARVDLGLADPENEAVVTRLKESVDALRETVAVASVAGVPMPVMAAALHLFLRLAYREEAEQ